MINQQLKDIVQSPSSGVIRKMFEEGAILKAKYGVENVYDFSIGNPDLDPPQKVLDAIKEVTEQENHLCHGYMPNAGYKETRIAMAKKTSIEQAIQIPFENIIMQVGAAGALNSTFKALINVGEQVIVPCPYFTEYDHYINNHGGQIVRVKTKDDFSLDSNQIKNNLTDKTCAILINSPNNPTGRIYSDQEIIELVKVLNEHGKKTGRFPYIICDEPYRAITYENKKVSAVFPKYENAIVVTSFAKNLSLPGERIGYVAVNPNCKESANLCANIIFATRTLGYVNAPAFFQRVIEKSWDAECDYSLYQKRRNLICKVMDQVGLKYCIPEGAFYLFVKVPEQFNDDDMAFINHLKKYNILCAPGSGFGGKGWFRLAYCCSEQTIINSEQAFKKAMNELV